MYTLAIAAMFNDVSDVLVKDLCEEISRETDERKASELIASLRTFLELENAEARLRIRQILLYYRENTPSLGVLTDRPASDHIN